MSPVHNNAQIVGIKPLIGISYVSIFLAIGIVLFNLGNETALLIQKYMGDDSFFYLVIAKNISQSGMSSFDGIHFTNGYHPLWQIIVSGLALVIRDDLTLMLATISLGITLSIVSLLFVYLLLGKLDVSPYLKAVSLLLGVFFILLPSWYGLESFLATSLLLGTLYYYYHFYQEIIPKSQYLLGLLLALTVLARLDAVFIASLFLVSRVLQSDKEKPESILSLIYLGCFFSFPILVYMAFNFYNTGHVMPISGALKSSFPDITMTNLPLQLEFIIRVVPPIISSLVVVLILSYRYVFKGCVDSSLLKCLFFVNVGVLLFACYEFLFQKDAMWGLRPWHFALPNAVMLVSLGPCVLRHLSKRLLPLVVSLLVVFNFIALNQKFLASTPQNPIKSDLYETANWVRQHTRPDEIIAVTDPGIIAFFGGRRTISLDGLANNYQYQEIVNNKELQKYLNENDVSYVGIFSRGHDITLPLNNIKIESRLYDSFDTLSLKEEDRVYTSPNGLYSLWKN